MKNIFPFLVIYISISLFLSVPGACGQAKEIKIMYFHNPPFMIINESTGELSGSTYEFIENYISKEMGVKFAWDNSPTSFPRQLILLKNSTDRAGAIIAYLKEREDFIAYTAKPYIDTPPAIAVLKDNKLNRISSIDDILDLRIGYGEGIYLTPFMRDKRIKFDFVNAGNFMQMNLKKIIQGRINAVYCPNLIEMLYLAKQLNIENRIKMLKLPEKPFQNYVAFSKGAGDIVIKYNQAFNKLDGRNLYKNILSKYINTVDL